MILKNIIKNFIIKRRFGKTIKLYATTSVTINSFFEGNNYIGEHSCFSGFMGYNSYVASECLVLGKVGRFCSIAPFVKVAQGNHPARGFVSTHPSFYSIQTPTDISYVKENKFVEYKYADCEKKYEVIIGNDVWIGYGAILLSGIRIGDGAIIGAGAVVTKDVEPYSIVGGVPARVIRKRFDQNEIKLLNQIKWWEKNDEWLKNNSELFANINDLIRFVEEGDIK